MFCILTNNDNKHLYAEVTKHANYLKLFFPSDLCKKTHTYVVPMQVTINDASFFLTTVFTSVQPKRGRDVHVMMIINAIKKY